MVPAVGGAALLVVLAGLLGLISRAHGLASNEATLLQIHRLYSPSGGALAARISRTTDPPYVFVATLIVALVAWLRGAKPFGIGLAAAAISAMVLATAFKFGFDEPRPHVFNGPLVEHTPGFPSGHAVLFTAILPVIAWAISHTARSGAASLAGWSLCALLILGIGFDRLYLGVHWPTDVIGGYMIGLACATLGVLATRSTGLNLISRQAS